MRVLWSGRVACFRCLATFTFANQTTFTLWWSSRLSGQVLGVWIVCVVETRVEVASVTSLLLLLITAVAPASRLRCRSAVLWTPPAWTRLGMFRAITGARPAQGGSRLRVNRSGSEAAGPGGSRWARGWFLPERECCCVCLFALPPPCPFCYCQCRCAGYGSAGWVGVGARVRVGRNPAGSRSGAQLGGRASEVGRGPLHDCRWARRMQHG